MTKTEGNGLGQEKGEVMSITLYRLKGGKDFVTRMIDGIASETWSIISRVVLCIVYLMIPLGLRSRSLISRGGMSIVVVVVVCG